MEKENNLNKNQEQNDKEKNKTAKKDTTKNKTNSKKKENNSVKKESKNKEEKNNEKVITTRDNDKYYSLDYRTKKANNENCDYFISIHLNSATNTSAKGCACMLTTVFSNSSALSVSSCSIKPKLGIGSE